MDERQNDPSSSDKPGTSAATTSSKLSNFTLSAILEAHQPQDAKCVAEIDGGGLVTGGRDGIMKIWTPTAGYYQNTVTVPQHDCLAINSVAVGGLAEGDCLIFCGRKNGSIAIFSMENGFNEPIKELKGHKSNVCALHFDRTTRLLMSGSWDHNALVWPLRSLLCEEQDTPGGVGIGLLSGHQCSVWAVATVPTGPNPPQFLTGSADKTILLWGDDYEQRRLFQGHTDVVRAIVVLSEKHFLSTSNDASIRLWDLASGSNLRTFYPDHQEFLYSLTRLDCDQEEPLIIASGEGGSIDIWALNSSKGQLQRKQSLKIPVHSVWFVTALSNGDFAVATSSGYVLIFTQEEARKAVDDVQEFFYSSQYEALEAKAQEMQKYKEENESETPFNGVTQNGGGMWRRIGTGDSQNFAPVPYQDPFTGTGRYVPGSGDSATPMPKAQKRSPIVPLPDGFCTFGLDGVSKKVLDRLREMNLAQPKELKMNEDEMCSTEQILTEREFSINECQVVALEKGILWSPETILPALDIFRIALLHPQLNEIFCSLQPVLGNPPKGAATMRRLLHLLTLADSPDPVRILVCRSLANAVSHQFGRAMLLTELAALWGAVGKQFCSQKAPLQIAASTALLNLARMLMQKAQQKEIVELGPREDALHALIDCLAAVDSFAAHAPLALVRLLQALIVLLGAGGAGDSGATSVAGCLRLEELQALAEAMRRMKDAVTDDDVKALTRELSDMIGAI